MGPPRRRDSRREASSSAEGGASAQSPRPNRRSWVAGVAAAVAVGAILYAGISRTRDSAYASRLPSLPDLSGHPSALRDHVTTADSAARAQPSSAEAVGSLGLAYHADMFYDEAEQAYALAEELSDTPWRWTYYRALAQGTRGHIDGLRAGLRAVVDAAPEFGPAWWRLGEAEFKAGLYEEAEDAWRRALPLSEPRSSSDTTESATHTPAAPVSAYAALGLARLAMVQGDTDSAKTVLETVTQESPGLGPAFRLLGDVYTRLGRVEDGRRAVRMADQLPQYEPYLDPLTTSLVRESRSTTFLLQQAATTDLTTNAAWREYLVRRALEFDPDHLDALADLATMYRLLRRYDEALALLERHQQQRPDDGQVLADIGRCLAGLRRFAEAEPVLRRALESLDNAHTRYALGSVLDQVGRRTEAVTEYRRALDRNPHHRDALNNLGVVLASQGQPSEAAQQFERLIAVDPDVADAHANLGLVLVTAGEHERAAAAFREALRLDQGHEGARAGLREIELR